MMDFSLDSTVDENCKSHNFVNGDNGNISQSCTMTAGEKVISQPSYQPTLLSDIANRTDYLAEI